jgi:hypothetical protein
MHTFRTIVSTLSIVAIFGLVSTEAMAERSYTRVATSESTTTSTLSYRSLRQLAKKYYDDFQAVDSSISYRDLVIYLYRLNTSSYEEAETALQAYLASLQSAAEPVNQAPTISGSPQLSLDEGQSYLFTPSASDPDGDPLRFSISNKPTWASFNSSTGALSGTPEVGSAGRYLGVTIGVTDGDLNAALPPFDIIVNAAQPTVVAGAPTLTSVDISGTNIVLSWVMENTIPEGGYDIFIDDVDTGTQYRTTATSASIGGLDLTQAHCFKVESRYTNTGEFYASNQLCSEAQAEPNKAPTISGSPATTVTEGEAYLFTPVASDPESDALSFSISNKPSWASFNSRTGTLSGTPNTGSAGLYAGITIAVSDGKLSATLPAFDLTVEAAATVVAGPPKLVSVDVSGSNIVLAWVMENAIPEGGYDTFIDNVDTGSQYRTTATSVTISGLDLTQAHCFKVESRYTNTSEFYASNELCSEAQAEPNNAPVITGTAPSSAAVGASYSFTPTASDADGDTLNFSISNLPSWASFNSQTGSLSGTPTTADVGTYSNIQIAVTDGTDTSSLEPFAIVVESTQTVGSTTLKWIAPSSREDGSALSLSEINGYRIYMGDSANSLEIKMDINDSSVTEYTVTDLPLGDHYFSVTVYDKEYNESEYSNIIVKPAL